MTEVKRLELDAAEKAAQVKIKEAEISEVTAKKLKDLADVHRLLGTNAGSAAGGIRTLTGAIQSQGDAAEAASQKLQALYDRHRLVPGGDKDKYTVGDGSDLVGKSRDVRYAGINETDINQQIAARYGEEMIGNAKAREAWQRKLELENYQKHYGNVMRSQQSLNEERNIRAELERLEREIEAEKQAKKTGGSTSSSSSTSAAQERTHAAGGAQSSTSSGVTQVTTYQSTVVLPNGQRRNVAYADRTSQSLGDQLMRELAEGKGVLQ